MREPREFQQGHIQGARLISLPQLLADPSQMPRAVPVVLTCRTGRRSSRVTGKLIEMGYDNLKILEGGLLAWVHDDGKVYNEKGETNRIHTFGQEWNLGPKSYEAIWQDP